MTFRNTKHPKRILQEDVQPLLPINQDKRNNDLQSDDILKCSICCENKKVKYVNCHKGGLQNELYGKWKKICKDKAMCFECRDRIRIECPFCKNHPLTMWTMWDKGRGPKKKAPFAARAEKRLKKIDKKKKKPKSIAV